LIIILLNIVIIATKSQPLPELKRHPIIVNPDALMAIRKISLNEPFEKMDLTPANLSILKSGKAKAIRFSTLEVISKATDWEPGDLLLSN
jgi:putative transcriptional regulator